jgi:2-dehydro-3-deoxyglucarate aldolase/4-hydroxy-2-oxoheptanedioate aldolase
MGVFGTPDQARALDEKRDLILAARKHGKTCSMLVSSQAGQAVEGRGRAAARLL